MVRHVVEAVVPREMRMEVDRGKAASQHTRDRQFQHALRFPILQIERNPCAGLSHLLVPSCDNSIRWRCRFRKLPAGQKKGPHFWFLNQVAPPRLSRYELVYLSNIQGSLADGSWLCSSCRSFVPRRNP